MHWDTGNIGFMLVSTSLVMLMTPGLAFFYGGLVGRKNVLTIMIQSFVSMGVTTVLWVLCGYSMCFSGSYGDPANPDFFGIIGNFRHAFLANMGPTTEFPASPTIPLIVFVAHQMILGRLRRSSPVRSPTSAVQGLPRVPRRVAAVCLLPYCYMIWEAGFAEARSPDFAGGIVALHCRIAALAAGSFSSGAGDRGQGTAQHSARRAWHGSSGLAGRVNAGSELADTVTSLAP